MINISEIVAKTEAMFDLLNEHFYQNELIRLRTPPKLRSQTGEIEHGFR